MKPVNRATSFSIWVVFFISSIAFNLSGCKAITTPTPLPPYIHYIPSNESNIRLEFDYPSYWIFSEEKIKDTDIILVGLGDPRLLTVPTRAPYESHGTPSDFGSISILIQSAKPGQTLDTIAESLKQANSGNNRVALQNDYKITINGYDARVLEYQINDLETYSSLMFDRSTFFVVKDQMYRISFTIAEKERGGEFEKEYEYFFKSLKIVL